MSSKMTVDPKESVAPVSAPAPKAGASAGAGVTAEAKAEAKAGAKAEANGGVKVNARGGGKTSVKAGGKSSAKPNAKGKSTTTVQQIVFDPSEDRSSVAEQARENPVILAALIENLSTDARRIRQFSAAAIGVVSESDPEILVIHIPHIVDALHRPEAQTRWESLEVLTRIVTYDPDACDEAVIGAEGSLYDEESGAARLAAVRFLCAYGSLDAKRSSRVWPLLDEAIQCYHGDPEFQDMLISVTSFASGHISKDVRASLASRMGFDSVNGKGALKRRATQIVELCRK
jgi:hypothetical protein